MEPRAARLTWDELVDRARAGWVAVVPVGTTERHGRHLPMETDAAIASEVAYRVGQKAQAVILPTLSYGILESPAFPGLFLSEHTYFSLVKEICLGIESIGFRRLLFISGHHENNPCILEVLKERYEANRTERVYCLAHCMSLLGQLMPQFIQGRRIGHADFRETSLMLALARECVHVERAQQPEAIDKSLSGSLQSVGVHVIGMQSGTVILCHDVAEVTSGGGYGEVSGASAEGGERILETLSDYLGEVVRQMGQMTLPGTR